MKDEFFQSVGLTNSEIKVYLAMLASGSSEARPICNLSSVPFGKIYDILYSLEHKGLVKVQNSSPKKFMAVEPQLGIKTLIEAKEKEVQSLYEQVTSVENELMHIYREKSSDSIFWSVAMGIDEGQRLLQNVLKEAKHEVLVYEDMEFMNKIGENYWHLRTRLKGQKKKTDIVLKQEIKIFQELFKRDIKIRILLGGIKKTVIANILEENDSIIPQMCDIRTTTHIAGSFILIDNMKVLLFLQKPIDPTERMAVIYLWRKDLGNELKQDFERLWKNGEILNPEV
jgi:sugar-specific transcriptional regulator TrmB